MTTELTLREKVLAAVYEHAEDIAGRSIVLDEPAFIDAICNTLDATGAPAYIRVADDLRGVEPTRDADVTPS